MNVYAYFEEKWPDLQYDVLVAIWKESWINQGWNPIVLGPKEAQSHPDYERFMTGVMTMPYACLPEYHAISFRRYIAMLTVGGGQLVDLDMINYGYTPGMSPRYDHCLQPGCAPCATALFYGSLCYRMMNWQSTGLVPHILLNGEHWSDMVFLSAYVKPLYNVSVNYGLEGWKTAPITHYSNGSFGNKDRATRIREARPLPAAVVQREQQTPDP